MAYLIHEHCNATSAIDKYWILPDLKSALEFFNEHVAGYKDYLDMNHYAELYETDEETEETNDPLTPDKVLREICSGKEDNYVQLTDDDYLVMTKIDESGFGRRP